MLEPSKQMRNLDELRHYIANALGRFELLQVEQCHFSETPLFRGDAECGLHFSLRGPRNVCPSAIWERDRNSVLFYGSCGRRLHRTKIEWAQLSVA
jgi:hypothetical protein